MNPPAQSGSPEHRVRRLFFAVLPDEAAVQALDAAVAAFRDARLRWLPSAGWHVTLRFIGNLASERVDDLAALVPVVAASHAPFRLPFDRIAPFPDDRRSAVLAAVAEAAPPAGLAVVADLEARCRGLGLPAEERPWRPHVSLARLRGRGGPPLASAPLRLELAVASLVLMESLPRAGGRRYRTLAHASFAGVGRA